MSRYCSAGCGRGVTPWAQEPEDSIRYCWPCLEKSIFKPVYDAIELSIQEVDKRSKNE